MITTDKRFIGEIEGFTFPNGIINKNRYFNAGLLVIDRQKFNLSRELWNEMMLTFFLFTLIVIILNKTCLIIILTKIANC